MIRLGEEGGLHTWKQLFLLDIWRSSVWKSNCIWTLLSLGQNWNLWIEMRGMSFLALYKEVLNWELELPDSRVGCLLR